MIKIMQQVMPGGFRIEMFCDAENAPYCYQYVVVWMIDEQEIARLTNGIWYKTRYLCYAQALNKYIEKMTKEYSSDV